MDSAASSSSTFGPETSQPERSTPTTAAMAASSRSGREKGRKSVISFNSLSCDGDRAAVVGEHPHRQILRAKLFEVFRVDERPRIARGPPLRGELPERRNESRAFLLDAKRKLTAKH